MKDVSEMPAARKVQEVAARENILAGVPPTVLVLLGIFTTQISGAIAKGLFATLPPAGAALLRVGFAAIILLFVVRPRFTGHGRRAYLTAILFGIALSSMNFAFYNALDRVPLGVAVTLEFVGPLGVAVAGSRRPIDVVWAVLAASGILLLSPLTTSSINPAGAALALLAGALWACYILLSQRTGRAFAGTIGLSIAMVAGSVFLLPIGIVSSGRALLLPHSLLLGLALSILGSALPYSFELQALRRIPARVFGVLLSLEPAVAAIVGFVTLHETLGLRPVIAILCVTIASAGAARFRTIQP